MVKLLLKNKADVNAKDNNDEYTPLHRASSKGHKSVVEVLLAHGADVNATLPRGSTALDIANARGDTALADFLTQHGARSGIPASIGA